MFSSAVRSRFSINRHVSLNKGSAVPAGLVIVSDLNTDLCRHGLLQPVPAGLVIATDQTQDYRLLGYVQSVPTGLIRVVETFAFCVPGMPCIDWLLKDPKGLFIFVTWFYLVLNSSGTPFSS